jgi:sarcosine oxidase, subunit beta
MGSHLDRPLSFVGCASATKIIGRALVKVAGVRLTIKAIAIRRRRLRFSAFNLVRQALAHNSGWPEQWRSPEPKASYDAIIVGAGGHGLATA